MTFKMRERKEIGRKIETQWQSCTSFGNDNDQISHPAVKKHIEINHSTYEKN